MNSTRMLEADGLMASRNEYLDATGGHSVGLVRAPRRSPERHVFAHASPMGKGVASPASFASGCRPRRRDVMTVVTDAQTADPRPRAAGGRFGWLIALLLLVSGMVTHARFGDAEARPSPRDSLYTSHSVRTGTTSTGSASVAVAPATTRSGDRQTSIPGIAQARMSAAIGMDDRSYYATPRADGFAQAGPRRGRV